MVRNMGTIGGSIANHDPAADYPAAVVGLNATVKTNSREIPADEFFTAMFSTKLEPDEIVVSVTFPVPRRAGYFKLPHPATGFVVAGAFVAEFDDQILVAINGATTCVFRSRDLEEALAAGFHSSNARMPEIDPDDICSDIHADAAYRKCVLPGVIKKALEQATASQSIFENGE